MLWPQNSLFFPTPPSSTGEWLTTVFHKMLKGYSWYTAYVTKCKQTSINANEFSVRIRINTCKKLFDIFFKNIFDQPTDWLTDWLIDGLTYWQTTKTPLIRLFITSFLYFYLILIIYVRTILQGPYSTKNYINKISGSFPFFQHSSLNV